MEAFQSFGDLKDSLRIYAKTFNFIIFEIFIKIYDTIDDWFWESFFAITNQKNNS
jgi:hypothetical protein